MKKEASSLYYITFQDFPAHTANSQQTISTCKYFVRNSYRVHLFFPMRSKNSSDNFDKISNYYEIKNCKFDVTGIEFSFKFENKKVFKKFNFVIKHILWSYKCVEKVTKNFDVPSHYMTRSEWVFFFLSRKNLKVVYECHQLTKLRKLVIQKSLNSDNSKIIFLNNNLLSDMNFKTYNQDKVLLQNNGYDEDYFYSNDKKKGKKVIFAGNLYRFGKLRNLDFIIMAFQERALKDYELCIVGGSNLESEKLKNKYNMFKNVSFLNNQSKNNLGSILSNSDIGLLLNDDNKHSMFYSDPLKFYEYLASGLNVVAPDFSSHRAIDKYNNVYFYLNNDLKSFISAVNSAFDNPFDNQDLDKLPTVDMRVKNIIKFINS